MKFQEIREAFDEYVLHFNAFPDLIFIGGEFYRYLISEMTEHNWKVRTA
ncbi:hypothetical protein HMPREF0023_2397, partial [Acinetobacter sp. ATCC 27244]